MTDLPARRLPAGSLTGAFALIQRGTCVFSRQDQYAQAAGAVAVIIYQPNGIRTSSQRCYVQNTGIPPC